MNYENQQCVACRKEFSSGDDVVVCPECGSPHHRTCWAQTGCCANAALHGQKYLWHPAETDDGNAQTEKESEKNLQSFPTFTCPDCGNELQLGSRSCPNCGANFVFSHAVPPVAAADFEKFFNADDAEPEFDGVTAPEMAAHIGVNADRYIPKFRKMNNGKKITWNWAAFFFSPYWLFYRKIYKVAAVAITVYLVASLLFSVPISGVLDRYTSAVEIFNASVSGVTDDAVIESAMDTFVASVAPDFSTVALYLAVPLVLQIIAGLTANIFYKKKCISKIKEIKQISNEDRQKQKILIIATGGVSLLAALGALIGNRIIMMLANYIV